MNINQTMGILREQHVSLLDIIVITAYCEVNLRCVDFRYFLYNS